MSEFVVEISDLRGWGAQVGRGSVDVGNAAIYAKSNIADAEFGAILELITAEYAALLPAFHGVLDADSTGLGSEQSALVESADAYRRADQSSSSRFGHGQVSDDGAMSPGFNDIASAWPIPQPSSNGETLPEVSFGFLLDKVCDLIVWVGGPDPREYVTKWIAGNVEKASMHASAWSHLSECVKSVEQNLRSGAGTVAQAWQGAAASGSLTQMSRWTANLASQSEGMAKMSGHLADMAVQAVAMAQVVVDIIKTVISMVSACLSSAYIPGYGQWKAIKTVKEAITLVNNARKVIITFWNALIMIKSTIMMVINQFSIDALPPSPSAVSSS